MSFVDIAAAIGGVALEAGASEAVAGGIGAVGAGALGGAGMGAATSALTGGNVGQGALFGALGGGLTGGIGSAIGAGGGAAAASATPSAAGSVANAIDTPISSLTPDITSEQIASSFPGTSAQEYNPLANMNDVLDTTGSQTGSQAAQTASALTPQQTAAASLNNSFFGKNPLMTVGAGGVLGSILGRGISPSQATPPGPAYNPLVGYKFNPSTFQKQPAGYTGYLNYAQGYADGGIASLQNSDPSLMASGTDKMDFMSSGAYPMSQQKMNFYSSPSQMPTSAQQAMSSYEPTTNPLTGEETNHFAEGGITDLGGYSDGGRMIKGPGDGVSDSVPATIADKQSARLADGEFVVPARIVSELGNGSSDAGARKLYDMMDRVQKARRKTTGKGKVAVDSKANKALPA